MTIGSPRAHPEFIAGVASLRYDLRGHDESDGRQEETVLTAHLNDIRVAFDTDFLDDEAACQLRSEGYVSHSPTVKHGQAMLNEVLPGS